MNHINIDLLLSNEEHLALPKEIKWKVPYLYSFERGGQILYYFGSKHTHDPVHPQFEFLHEKWQDFLEKTRGKKSIVIHEGIVNEKNLVSLERVIGQYGESGAIVFWANQEHIPFFRPEPTIEYEAEKLLKEFSKEEIFYFYIIRGIVTWQRTIIRKEFDEYVKANIKRYQDVFNWSNFDFSFDAVKKMHKQIFGKEFDLNDKEYIAKIPSPSFNDSRINEIARESATIRDIAIAEHIGKHWHEGYNIFIVYGANHARKQERAIKDMVETQN